ncbi:MAG: DUF5666 domain-containing protein, partial [Steroidobacteraceae bacterium]
MEQVNAKTSTVVVLGQTYHIAPSTAIKSQSGKPLSLDSLAANELVAIQGSETANGEATVSVVTRFSQLDVPGATQLFVTGVVSSETATGQIHVGKLTVDVTATLTSDTQKFAVGDLVEISGTQPNPNGLFLAQSIASLNGIDGSGKASTATLGIDGS